MFKELRHKLINWWNTLAYSVKSSGKRISIDICYVLVWGIITLASSYNMLLHHCSFDFLLHHDGDYNYVVIPLIIWMVAYFLDYVYNAVRKEKNELISLSSVKKATVSIIVFLFCLVIILAQSSYLYEFANVSSFDSWLSLEYRTNIRTFCLLIMFICILGLKWESINSLYYKNEVRKS